MGIIEGAGKIGPSELGLGLRKPAVGLYDFAVDGGAVSAINLRGDKIPNGAVIVDALFQVDTALTGGTGTDTLSLGSEAAADLQTAAARSGAPWSTTGAKRLTLDADAVPVKTTAERSIRFDIAGTALTAGKFRVVVWYVELA